jgi:hypothetical protein
VNIAVRKLEARKHQLLEEDSASEVTQIIFSISLGCHSFDCQVEILWSLQSERSMPISQ